MADFDKRAGEPLNADQWAQRQTWEYRDKTIGEHVQNINKHLRPRGFEVTATKRGRYSRYTLRKSAIAASAAIALLLATPHQANAAGPIPCPSRAWCGCWLSNYLGLNDRSLWVAFNWLTDKRFRRISGPTPGAIVVFKHSHVGVITAVPAPGKIKVLSGNDSGAVRDRVRSTADVLAYLSR